MNYIDSAVRDGRDLMSWADPSRHLTNTSSINAIVQDTMHRSVAPEFAIGVPLLFSAYPGRDPVPMMTAEVTDVLSAWRVSWCASKACQDKAEGPSWQLVIPGPAHAVVIPWCQRHRDFWDSTVSPIVWN